MSSLEEKVRQLRYVDKFTLNQIANLVGCSIKDVKNYAPITRSKRQPYDIVKRICYAEGCFTRVKKGTPFCDRHRRPGRMDDGSPDMSRLMAGS